MSKPVMLPEPWFRGRWTAQRKARVCDAIVDGDISETTACEWYGLSAEELASWMQFYAMPGAQALRTTKLLKYRGQA